MPSVLVVDDSRRARSFSRALEDAGCQVTIVRDGDEAIRSLAETPYDGLLIEMVQSDTHGFDTVVEVRRRWPACRVVAMSGGGRFLSRDEALDIARVLGVHAQLRRPFSADDLLAAFGATVADPVARG